MGLQSEWVGCVSFLLRSHLDIKARPMMGTTQDNFFKTGWDMTISWQLQGLCGCYGLQFLLLCGCYSIYVAVMASTQCFHNSKIDFLE